MKSVVGCYHSVTGSDGFSLTPVDTATGAGFPNLDFAQLRERRLEPVPDPAGDIFTGWIFQSWNVVQIIVIQLVVDRFEAGLEVGKIHNPAGRFRRVAIYREAYLKRMAMQSCAFMPLGDIGEAMSGLEVKFLVDFHNCALAFLVLVGRGVAASILVRRGARTAVILLLKSTAFNNSVFFGVFPGEGLTV